MKSNAMYLVLVAMIAMLTACIPAKDNKPDTGIPTSTLIPGETVPKPVFQLGDNPSTAFPDGAEQASDFVNFFNKTYGTDIDVLTKENVVWFPPQSAGDTSLELVARVTPGETANCDDPTTYPILCEDNFSTGDFCKACHDSALFVEGGGLAEMSYFSEPDFTDKHQVWLANWSQYGDWSANIMRLATRDPIWQAQIETETSQHPYADPKVIQDVCFSCHGEMGERQLKFDLGMDQHYCTDLFYATIPGYLSENQKGKPYPFTGDCEPIKGKSIEDHQSLYAKYGSLGRDGVSCETCHRIGPENSNGKWNGHDYEVFYGKTDTYNVAQRQTLNPVPLPYEFTATFDYDMSNVLTPDPVDTLDAQPMLEDDNLTIAQAMNEKTGESYLGQAIMCGTCHVLIVPQIPGNFQPNKKLPTESAYLTCLNDNTEIECDGIPKDNFYLKPESCKSDKYAPATNGIYGNPVTDQCVALGYEQATYLEWINSSFASEEDNNDTCQGCHMPQVTNPKDPHNHKAVMAQSTEGLTPKDYRRHRLMGINLPVFEMFMQFPDVLGVAPYDDLVPPSGTSLKNESADYIQNYLLNGQMAIVEQATSQANGNGLKPDSLEPDKQAATEITINTLKLSATTLQADLTIVNNTGHKFPSGAGFRRAFLKFEVMDNQGNLLWVSGQANPYGAICNGVCVKQPNGTYNLLASEVTQGNPQNLQPHHQVVNSQEQVQIYEVQAVDDTGMLTSQTLSLFYDAKDNRLLPKGFINSEQLDCENNPNAGHVIFGIKQCSAAYATDPQLNPLTENSTIDTDKHYTDSAYAGSDQISYQIPLDSIPGTPASIKVTMEYQTIPPGFLAARFNEGTNGGKGKKGTSKDAHLTATERSIYLTSHLNTNLALKSEHPNNPDLTFSQNWTTSIYQASAEL